MKLPGHGISWKDFFIAAVKGWNEHQISTNASAIAFSGLLALFPFLIFVVSLAGLMIRPDQVEEIVRQLESVAPPEVTVIVTQEIRRIAGGHAGLLTLGFVGSIWAASGGTVSAMNALNDTYGVREGRPFWKARGIAILTTLLVAALSLFAILVFVAAEPVARAVGEPLGSLLLWLRWPVSGLTMMLVLALLYYVLPDVEQSFKFLTPGSIFAMVVWLISSWGFTEYVTHFNNYTATYGTLGGVAVLLIWMA